MRGRSSERDADAGVGDRRSTRAVLRRARCEHDGGRVGIRCRSAPSPSRAPTACRALVNRLTSTVRSRSPSVSNDRRVGIKRKSHRRIGLRGFDGAGGRLAQRVDVGVRQVEADRTREIEHLVDDAIQAFDLAVDIGGRFADVGGGCARRASACRSAPLMIISGLRTLVRDDRRHAAERRQPLALRRFALKARDRIDERIEGRRQQASIFVVPAARAAQAGSSA